MSGQDRILVTGEALGLVHPISGEGIDFALESGQLAAKAILDGWQQGRIAIQKKYRAALGRKFSVGFALTVLLKRLVFRDVTFDKVLDRLQHRPYLHNAVVEFFFGQINPISVFTPRTLWGLLKPWD